MKILAIESSCDETAAAIVEDLPAGRQVELKILSTVVASSTAMHVKYGGIVPEVAAREQLKCIIPTIDETLKLAAIDLSSVDALAITVGPGLIGSLLVGVETVKTIALATGIPVIPVNHVLAHMYANFISNDDVIPGLTRNPIGIPKQVRDDKKVEFPAISLVVSGGHTELFLMESEKKLTWLGGTLDDAAGEAFDKIARLLGFENRGGPAIQEAASRHSGEESSTTPESKTDSGHARMTKLPRPLMYDKTLNFSFSGLKTAILRAWEKEKNHDTDFIQRLAYEVQESITDVLVSKTLHAAATYHAKSLLVSGGVAANLRLREKFQTTIANLPAGRQGLESTISLHIPPIQLCTDNAVYIASYAYFRGEPTDWHTITAVPDLSVEV